MGSSNDRSLVVYKVMSLEDVISDSKIDWQDLQKLAVENEALALGLLTLVEDPRSNPDLWDKLTAIFGIFKLAQKHLSACTKILNTPTMASELTDEQLFKLHQQYVEVRSIIENIPQLYQRYQHFLSTKALDDQSLSKAEIIDIIRNINCKIFFCFHSPSESIRL